MYNYPVMIGNMIDKKIYLSCRVCVCVCVLFALCESMCVLLFSKCCLCVYKCSLHQAALIA